MKHTLNYTLLVGDKGEPFKIGCTSITDEGSYRIVQCEIIIDGVTTYFTLTDEQIIKLKAFIKDLV